MKKLFLIAILFLVVGFANSQDKIWSYTSLYCADYAGTDIRDTVDVNGSTDAGSGWFTGKSYDDIYLRIYNGTAWYLYKIGCPGNLYSKYKVYMEGADTTISVAGYGTDAQPVYLPIMTSQTVFTFSLDIGVTTAYYVGFIGVIRKD